jgi:FkbH-like protein
MYVSDRERRTLQVQLGSVEKWLEMLDLQMSVERLTRSNLERAAQLFNKTNQMNLSTRRMPPQELSEWATPKNHLLLTFRVKDRIGDYGLCGLASLDFNGSQARLVDFVLSCRAMGRGVEEAMISVMANRARESGYERVEATFIPTPKNKPCLRWLESQSAFVKEDGTFFLDLSRDIPLPKHVRITCSS